MFAPVTKMTDRSSMASTKSCSAFGNRPRTIGSTFARVSKLVSDSGSGSWLSPAEKVPPLGGGAGGAPVLQDAPGSRADPEVSRAVLSKRQRREVIVLQGHLRDSQARARDVHGRDRRVEAQPSEVVARKRHQNARRNRKCAAGGGHRALKGDSVGVGTIGGAEAIQ